MSSQEGLLFFRWQNLKDSGWWLEHRSATCDWDNCETDTSGVCDIGSEETAGAILSSWVFPSDGPVWFSIGLAAIIVILILQAGDGRINCLWERTSHCSHSSSIWMMLVFRSRYTPKRKGASPTAISFGGGMVLLVPLHATTCLITLSGKSAWICEISFESTIDRRPTRGNKESTWSKIRCHNSELLGTDCLFPRRNLFWLGWSCSIGCVRTGFGLAASRRFFASGSEVSLAANDIAVASVGISLITLWLHMIPATFLANFRGYNSVYLDRFINWPLYRVLPSMIWWSWLVPTQRRPCMLEWNCFEVVNICRPFFMGFPFSGSLRLPATHMSNSINWE